MKTGTKDDVKFLVRECIWPILVAGGFFGAAASGMQNMLKAGGLTFWFYTVAVFILGVFVGFAVACSRGIREARLRVVEQEIAEKDAERGKREEIMRMIDSVSRGQSDIIAIAFEENRGFSTSATSRHCQVARLRPDVFEISEEGSDRARINLSKEWNVLMNEHGELFFETWNKRKMEKAKRDGKIS